MSAKGYKRLKNIRAGVIFETKEGTQAVKSEYFYSNKRGSQCLCILLESGEFAHFSNKNNEWVKPVIIGSLKGGLS